MAARGSEQFRSGLDDLLKVIARALVQRHLAAVALQPSDAGSTSTRPIVTPSSSASSAAPADSEAVK